MKADRRPAGPSLSGIVLAGGLSERLGCPKALVEVGGQTLLERVVSTLTPMCGELLLSLKPGLGGEIEDAGLALGMSIVWDRAGYDGPLAGLHAGLSSASRPLSVVLAVDHPFPSPEVLRLLTAAADAGEGEPRCAVPEVGGRLQPLLTVYPSREWGLHSGASLADGILSPSRMIRRAIETGQPAVEVISDDRIKKLDPELLSLLDVDTPQDLKRSRRIATASRAP